MILLLALLCACGGGNADNELVLSLREDVQNIDAWSGEMELTADYGQRVYDYSVSFTGSQEEGTTLTITAPEEAAGITAVAKEGQTWLDYDGVRLETGPLDPQGLSPMDALPDVDLSKLPKVERPRSFSPYDADALTPCHRKVYDIQIPEAPLLRFTSANDASPGTLVNLFLARAIDSLHPHRDNPIVGGYVMNARPMLGAPKSPANCVSSMRLEYKDRMKGMDLTTQATIYRGMTFLQSDEERVRQTLLMAAARYRMAAAIPTLAGRQEAFSQFMTMGAGVYTFTVSYVGKGNYGGAEKYIREFWTHVPTAMPILIEVAAIHGNIFLSLHQRFEEDLYVRAFLRQFEENGIPAKLVHVSAGELPGVVDLGTL